MIMSIKRSMGSDAASAVVTLLTLWVIREMIVDLSNKGIIMRTCKRKAAHILTGPIFIFMWCLFSDSFEGAVWASLVPFCMTIQFGLIGLGYISDPATVEYMTCHNNCKELLHGPFYYGLVFVIATLCLWKSQTAVIATFCLCFGDGFAEIFGTRFMPGMGLLPWSSSKTWAGSMGFFLCSVLSTLGFMHLINLTEILGSIVNNNSTHVFGHNHHGMFILRVVFVAWVSSVFESLVPSASDQSRFRVILAGKDNIFVFVGAVVADYLYRLLF